VVKLVLIEDDPMVRRWVEHSLEDTEFRIAGHAETCDDGVALAVRLQPDLLLLDNRLPDAPGTEALRRLRREGIGAPALMMTARREPGFNEQAREAGAQGALLKSGSAAELLTALRTIRAGELAFDSRHPPRPAGQRALTPAERATLRLLSGGATNKEIAQRLNVSDETVKTLLSRAYSKLGVRGRAEAVRAAYERGLL